MNENQWREYYVGMAKSGFRSEKLKEMVAKCGGLLPEETQQEAETRLVKEINTLMEATWHSLTQV